MSNPKPSDSSVEALNQSEVTSLAQRLDFLEISEADRARLRDLAPRLKACAPGFVELFYRHLFAFEQTARFLQDPELVARLKEAQQRHLETMLEADWDEEYVARRYRVGDVHAQVGINPQMFLGAYNQYLQYCLRELSNDLGAPARELTEQILSLQKAVFLDVGLTLEAYFTQATLERRQALDLVYRANAELRNFAQLTSHDLKTPLATVANLCEEVLDEFGSTLPPQAADLIGSARERVFRMSKTIDELLHSTTSLHADAIEDHVASQEMLQEVSEQLRPTLKQRQIDLSIADGLPTVLGDKARLREVFYNLLSNAVKFSDKPHGRIQISCKLDDNDCVFAIADNGPGIPADELARIFVPFRRLPVHRGVPGSGLGLYFAKTIVDQQRGRIWAESKVGVGSTFFVALKRPRKTKDMSRGSG
jgi:signal transduction histidine kinase